VAPVRSPDLINKDTSTAFVHKILVVFVRCGEEKCAVEYSENWHIFF
jgi:hypothetical protein